MLTIRVDYDPKRLSEKAIEWLCIYAKHSHDDCPRFMGWLYDVAQGECCRRLLPDEMPASEKPVLEMFRWKLAEVAGALKIVWSLVSVQQDWTATEFLIQCAQIASAAAASMLENPHEYATASARRIL